jgi:hypothetical protein
MPKNMFVGTGISKADDSFTAGKEAVEMAMEEMKKKGGKNPNFGLVFCSGRKYSKTEKDIQKLVDGAHSVFNKIPWVGCTTCGEIYTKNLEKHSCVAMVLSTEYLNFSIGVGNNVHKDPKKAGELATKEAVSNLQPEKILNPYLRYLAAKKKSSRDLMRMYSYFILLLSPGHLMDRIGKEEYVLDGVFSVIGKQTPVIGGTAGDDGRLVQTYQFANGKVYKDAAIATAISCGLKVGFGFDHGYKRMESCIVTDAEDNIVKEINGKPAASEYARMLGMKLEELWPTKAEVMTKLTPIAKLGVKYFDLEFEPKNIPFMSVGISNPMSLIDIHDNVAVRVPRAIKGEAVEFYEKIPKGIQLHRLKVDPNSILNAEVNAIDWAAEDAGGEPELILMFDCAFRRIFLINEEKFKEFMKILAKKYPKAEIIGFNSMGEYTYNRTMTPSANGAVVSVGVITDKLLIE